MRAAVERSALRWESERMNALELDWARVLALYITRANIEVSGGLFGLEALATRWWCNWRELEGICGIPANVGAMMASRRRLFPNAYCFISGFVV